MRIPNRQQLLERICAVPVIDQSLRWYAQKQESYFCSALIGYRENELVKISFHHKDHQGNPWNSICNVRVLLCELIRSPGDAVNAQLETVSPECRYKIINMLMESTAQSRIGYTILDRSCELWMYDLAKQKRCDRKSLDEKMSLYPVDMHINVYYEAVPKQEE